MPLIFLLSANFIFYITFVQFGLLRMIDGRFGLSIESLGLPLGLMALTGALASVSMGYLIDKYSLSLRRIFRIAAIISILEGAVAVFSMAVFDRDFLPPLFVVLGLLMGTNGVLVIRTVEAWPLPRRGFMAGCAMALVYLAANIIAGFVSMPERVALINGVIILITGVLCLSFQAVKTPVTLPSIPSRQGRGDIKIPSPPAGFIPGVVEACPESCSLLRQAQDERHRRGKGEGRIFSLSYLKAVITLTALVAVDSFLFHIETNRDDLYRYTWDGRWLWNGIVHAVTAIAAGLIWDRRGERPVLAITLSAFALALMLLILFPIGYFTGLISTLFYNTAVSFYGIMLLIVWFCATSDMRFGLRIGIGMALAGWVGSPLGIALAMAALPLPASAAFLGPLIIIVFLFLINARIVNLPQRRRETK